MGRYARRMDALFQLKRMDQAEDQLQTRLDTLTELPSRMHQIAELLRIELWYLMTVGVHITEREQFRTALREVVLFGHLTLHETNRRMRKGESLNPFL